LTGYLLAASVGTSILGRLGDMYGKERLLLLTLVILAAGTLLAAVSSPLNERIGHNEGACDVKRHLPWMDARKPRKASRRP
jgi:MFS family permease